MAVTKTIPATGSTLDLRDSAETLTAWAWVRISPGVRQLAKISKFADRTPEISECHRISGEDCFLLKVQVPSIESLEDILDKFLSHGQTTSSFIVSTPVPPRPPVPSAGPHTEN